jgi:signal transduction histidine kinase
MARSGAEGLQIAMRMFDWERLKKMLGLLATDRPEPLQQAERIVQMLRDVVLPSKAGLCLVVLYYLFYSGWLADEQSASSVTLETLKRYFLSYLVCNFVGAILFISWRRLPLGLIQWLAFILGLLDGVFIAGITMVTGGYASIVFWLFPALIVLNALTIPLAMPQIVLNVLLSLFYACAVLLTPRIGWEETLPDPQALANMVSQSSHVRNGSGNGTPGQPGTTGAAPRSTNQLARAETLAKLNKFVWKSHAAEDNSEEVVSEPLVLRLFVLWLLTLCCYGAQVLLERQREAIQEAAEFASREGQLHSAGRLAAEFAHQIKNPLAVINNAAYSLRRSLRDQGGSPAQQIEIIQEEVARADKVITQIMGYAQLSEGRVERLKVIEEIERAVEQVFPEAVPTGVKLTKRLTGPFPRLLMQRGHLSEILVNLLLNAREALSERGQVLLTARCNREQAVEIAVADDGPGIPPDKLGRVFEAYFTTKEKGTGLGLAIVKHNTELYGGTVRVESMLGQGAKFTVTLPAKSQPKPFAK